MWSKEYCIGDDFVISCRIHCVCCTWSSADAIARQWMMLRQFPRHPQAITASALVARLASEGHAVTKRTVERDLQTLSTHFPLVCEEEAKPFRWSWQKDAPSLDLPGLSPMEALVFHLAERHLGSLLPASALKALSPHFRLAEDALTRHARAKAWAQKIRMVPAAQPLAAPQPARLTPVLAASPRPIAPPRPVAPPRPPRPPINWAKVWERGWQLVVSGALLRGLLYLGALMIVASAVVLVVRFWSTFPVWLQIGFVAAVPLTFYAGGFILRRLKIPVAGSVLTGIGALLVAVDLAAVYQLGGLRGCFLKRSLLAISPEILGHFAFCGLRTTNARNPLEISANQTL